MAGPEVSFNCSKYYQRSIDIFTFLQKKLATEYPEVKMLYLSTNIIPKQRKEVIIAAKHHLDNNKPLVMVSTQSIEAGVDLDFNIGFRDLAPLTSLVQTAGRINREGRLGEYAPVYSPNRTDNFMFINYITC